MYRTVQYPVLVLNWARLLEREKERRKCIVIDSLFKIMDGRAAPAPAPARETIKDCRLHPGAHTLSSQNTAGESSW